MIEVVMVLMDDGRSLVVFVMVCILDLVVVLVGEVGCFCWW